MRFSVAVVVSCITAIGFAAAADVQAAIRKSTNIPAQGLGPALQVLAKERGFQVVYVSDEVNSLHTQGASGDLTSDEALTQLLNGTGLTYRYFGDNAVGIVSTAAESSPSSDTKKSSLFERLRARGQVDSIRLAAADQPENSKSPEAQDSATGFPKDSDRRVELEEIVVTGSHIRGVDSSSPVLTFTRETIDLSGASTLQQFIQKLPQNFSGGASDFTVNGATGSGQVVNRTDGTGINLRGLGNDATLVLIDGRRVAPANTSGDFIDISMIPLTAVERVEVLPDGASAIYGSDAVGGVVNFILNHNFSGAETRARYGSVTEGHSAESQVGQTFGHDWDSGNALLSYEYYRRTPLDSNDRSYTEALPDPYELVPRQERHAAFASMQQDLSSDVTLFADGSFAKRSSQSDATPGVAGRVNRNNADVEAFTSTLGVRALAFSDTRIEGSVSYSGNDTDTTVVRNGSQLLVSLTAATNVLSADVKADGTLAQLPAGPVLYAIGGQYRDESFERTDRRTSSTFEPSRDVVAGFLEFKVPLLGPASGATGPNRLDLQLAGRHERYSDFGSSTNPRVGLSWHPVSSLNVRGTYGTSFKAPLLANLDGRAAQIIPVPVFDPLGGTASCAPFAAGSDCTNTLFVFGGNPDLTAEKARTWTAGIDWEPEDVRGLRASATYYNIHFKDRITDAQGVVSTLDVLRQEAVLGPEIVQRSPSPALIQSYATDPAFVNFFNIPLSAVTVLTDYRIHNLGLVDTSGIDLSVGFSTPMSTGTLQLGIDGTYILDYDTQFTETSPSVSIVSTPYNPVDLRMRGHAMFQRGGVTWGLFLNYVNSYRDKSGGGLDTPISSWTTADASVSYRPEAAGGVLHGLALTLGVSNLTDEDPPVVVNEDAPGVNYDGANANPLGRFVYVELSKRWGK